MPSKGPNKRGGWEDFFMYCMKIGGKGGFFSEINKRGSPFTRHLSLESFNVHQSYFPIFYSAE